MDGGQLRVSFYDIAGDRAWEGLPIRLLDLRQLLDQPLLLSGIHRHPNLVGKDLAPRPVHAPPRGNGTGTAGRVELELPDILLRQQEDAARFIGGQLPEINRAIDMKVVRVYQQEFS